MNYSDFEPSEGYLTAKIRSQYISYAVDKQLLPVDAHRMPGIIALTPEKSPSKPIQFWQLYSVLGPERIVSIMSRFYELVFQDEAWFTSVFKRVGSKERHVLTQSSMWIDVMGGGMQYHGGEFRLNFHHTHNAFELMNERGASRWIDLMVSALNDPETDYTEDTRVRSAINTFLSFFMRKYEADFGFEISSVIGELNPSVIRRINFMNMTSEQVEELSEVDIRVELQARGVDVSELTNKQALINKALSL